MLGMASLSSHSSGDGLNPIWFARVELIDFLAWGALGALLCILGYRGYQEFWIPRRRKAAAAKLLQDINKES